MSALFDRILDSQTLSAFFSLALTMSIATFLLRYLNDSKRKESLLKEELKRTVEELKDFKGKRTLENLIKSSFSDKEKENHLINLYKNEIEKRVDEIRKLVEQQNKKEDNPREYRYLQLINNFETIRKRLFSEVDSLSRRANLNLTIGIISSIIAIGFLFYSGWYSELNYEGKWFNFITFFLPKFSLLIFLGTFSFYFLNLYKSNLGVIQNYQNELNNVDFKIISLTSLLLSEHQDKDIHLKELIMNISASDWNRVLKKDETTVELQKLKEFNSFDKEMAFRLWTMNQFFNSSEGKQSDNKTK